MVEGLLCKRGFCFLLVEGVNYLLVLFVGRNYSAHL